MQRPGFYSVELSMSANGSDTDTFAVPSDIEFEVVELQHKKTGACHLDEISDKLGGNRIDKSFPVELIAGDGARRVVFPGEWRIPPNTTVTVRATDKSAAANTLNLVFLGIEHRVVE
ncbi:MAG: hypothetical protein L0Z48_10710 [candidate division Zixibacteria bacterium]|nr:hypothetical protein [candidate division Zixibacteria bacterium]